MARGRMLSSSLGGSRKFSRLTSNDARLIYCLLIAHTDAYGRVEADPDYVKGTVLSRVPVTSDEVQAALEEMRDVGLIDLYLVDNFQYAEIVGFTDHNRTYPSREAQTTIPAPDGNVPERPARDDADASNTNATQDPVVTESGPRRGKVPTKRNRKRNTEVEEEVSQEQGAPSQKPSPKNETKPSERDLAAVPLPDYVARDAWTDFVAHRHKLRKTLTERAVELILADLAKTPGDANEMLRRTVTNGWTGIFPLDKGSGSPRSPNRALPTAADFERIPTNAELLGLPGGDP